MEYNILLILFLIVSGFVFGLLSILVGIGGGLMNVPYLIYVIGLDPPIAGFVSSFVIVFTSTSGFIKYRSENRVDYKTASKFLVVAIPGSILGGYLATTMDPSIIKLFFAIIIGISGIRGVIKALGDSQGKIISAEEAKEKNLEKRVILTTDGKTHEYYVNMRMGLPFAFLGGFLAGLLGVGGGIIYMPLMLSITGVPVHLAVPTSAAMIVVVSIFAIITRIITQASLGTLDLSYLYLYGLPLAFGAVIGARVGASKLKKIKSKYILVAFWSIAVISAIRMGFSI